jgi:hypothetical protein
MKKCCIALLLLLCAGFSLYAQAAANVSIFFPSITGYGRSLDENRVINVMITNQLTSRKYTLLDAAQGANFTLHGSLGTFDENDDYENHYVNRIQPTTTYTFYAPTWETVDELYIFQLILRNAKTGEVILQNVVYASLDDVYTFFPVLMHNLFTHLSGPGSVTESAEGDNDRWKNKWIYFRASFDYPITFYLLQPDGLLGDQALFNEATSQFERLDHKVMAMPGATVGAEFQLFNFLTLELNFQLSMGDTRDNYFINTAAGLELKFPIKFDNIMLVPYGAFLFPLNVSPVFSEFPPFAAGGGVQFCTRAGKRGAFFVDVKYMLSFTDAVMHNPWLMSGEQPLFPEPAVIHYERSQLGIGIGYKVGIIDKQKKTATMTITY